MSRKAVFDFDPNESEPSWDPETQPGTVLTIDGIFTPVEVLGRLKSGKEATVYVCAAGDDDSRRLVAAKFYRSLESRGFRNDAVYREGRTYRGRVARAIANRSGFARDFGFHEWIGREFAALTAIHARGGSVPRPLVRTGHAILLDYFGDESGCAPMLHRVRLGEEEARRAFDDVVANVRLILRCDLVHGDLSAHNILWWEGRPRLIDFPQAVDARTSPHAFDLLVRDLDNVCTWFRRWGVDESGPLLARDFWDLYQRGRL